MIYYVMAAVYSMILPLILLVTGVIHYKTPSVICIGCSFLLLIGLILFKRKEFKEEMHKKFHVGDLADTDTKENIGGFVRCRVDFERNS